MSKIKDILNAYPLEKQSTHDFYLLLFDSLSSKEELAFDLINHIIEKSLLLPSLVFTRTSNRNIQNFIVGVYVEDFKNFISQEKVFIRNRNLPYIPNTTSRKIALYVCAFIKTNRNKSFGFLLTDLFTTYKYTNRTVNEISSHIMTYLDDSDFEDLLMWFLDLKNNKHESNIVYVISGLIRAYSSSFFRIKNISREFYNIARDEFNSVSAMIDFHNWIYGMNLSYIMSNYEKTPFADLEYIDNCIVSLSNFSKPGENEIKKFVLFYSILSLYSYEIKNFDTKNIVDIFLEKMEKSISGCNNALNELKSNEIVDKSVKNNVISFLQIIGWQEVLLYLLKYSSALDSQLIRITNIIVDCKTISYKIPYGLLFEKKSHFRLNEDPISEDIYEINKNDLKQLYKSYQVDPVNFKAKKMVINDSKIIDINHQFGFFKDDDSVNSDERYSILKHEPNNIFSENRIVKYHKNHRRGFSKGFHQFDLSTSYLVFEYFLLNELFVKNESRNQMKDLLKETTKTHKLKFSEDLIFYNKRDVLLDAVAIYCDHWIDFFDRKEKEQNNLNKKWPDVISIYKNNEIVKGTIKERTKGGLSVDILNGLTSFLPGSEIDNNSIRDYDVFVGKTMDFKIVQINEDLKNIVVSHKELIEEYPHIYKSYLEEQRKNILSKLDIGQILEGVVKNITPYGVFVDLGGVDGLIHITDLSWSRIQHPNEVLSLDKKIKVVTLDFDENKTRIQLGLKQLTENPWESLDVNLKVGDKVKANVVVLADYGAFVEIIPGVEALIHVSEMSWSTHLRSAHDFLKLGEEVEAQVLTLDREERKMTLGIKQLYPDPWVKILEKYPVDSKHSGVVKNFTNFGIFLKLEEGVDGLIHISDLSWTQKIKYPADFTQIGNKLEVIVLDIDTENKRLSLGHKQLQENPWDAYETIFIEDSIHEGEVVNVFDKGATVLFKKEGLEGYIPKRYCINSDKTKLEEGEVSEFKVLEFSKDNRRIIVCLKNQIIDFKNEDRKRKKKKKVHKNRVMKDVQSKINKATLGDLSVLSDLKKRMDNKKYSR